MLSRRVGYTKPFVLSQNTPDWKLHRKNIGKIAGSNTAVQAFDSVQEEEAVHLLLKIRDHPDDLFEHIRMEAGAVILQIAYGYTPNSHGGDALVDIAGKTMEQFGEASVPGKFLVDVFPFRKCNSRN